MAVIKNWKFNIFSKKSKCTLVFLLLMLVSFQFRVYWDTEEKNNYSDSFMSRRFRIGQTLRYRIVENSTDADYTIRNNTNDWSMHDAELMVYSAYIDNNVNVASSRNNYSLKLVSIVHYTYSKRKLNCAIKISDKEIIIVNAVINVLPDRENLKTSYFGAFVSCSYSKTIHPTHVSLSWTNTYFNWTIIQFNEMKIVETTSMVVCVRPMFGDFISLLSAAEFISFYEANGVNKFVFYNYSAPSYVNTYFNMLSLKNYSIEVLPWTLPFKADANAIHEYGQILQIQDCIFRHQYKFKYVISVDLDEFMVPRVHRDLKDFIEQMSILNPKAGSFIVPNVFFCTEFIPPTLRPPLNGLPLVSTNGIWRENYVWEAKKRARTKWIILPERVNFAVVHKIIQHVDNYESVDVATSIIIMHHYKECGLSVMWSIKRYWKLKNTLENKELLRFKKEIESSLAFQVLTKFL